MSDKPNPLAIAIVCIGLWLVSWPANLANFQGSASRCEYAQDRYRKDLGFSMLWSAFPPAWFLTPFLTGFYEHGFQIYRRVCR